MRPLYFIIISLVCALAAFTGPASAGPADITVTSSSIDPPVLMKGDTGMLTIAIQNNGAESVAIRSARLFGSGVVPLSDSYPAVGELGAKNTKTFTFNTPEPPAMICTHMFTETLVDSSGTTLGTVTQRFDTVSRI